jgi:hypothetical protein
MDQKATPSSRGRTVCPNGQALPMRRIDREVLDAFREELLNPLVLDRALVKLRDRLQTQPHNALRRAEALESERARIRQELGRLAAAIAGGAALSSVMDALRERERRRDAIANELAALRTDAARDLRQLADVESEIRGQLDDWRGMLGDDTAGARQMLRTLLPGRLVFTPQEGAVEFVGEGDLGRLFTGLVDLSTGELPKALGSPSESGQLWKQEVRKSVCLAA